MTVRLPAARPVEGAVAAEVEEVGRAVAKTLPNLQALASQALAAMVHFQAKADPRPTHDQDERHGHKPVDPPIAQPPVAHPPVAQPPAAQPPVSQPPGSQPPAAPAPVAQPPVISPPASEPPPVLPPHRLVGDDTVVAGRLLSILAQSLQERDAIRAEGEAFIAYAAERQAFAEINRNSVATSLLQGFRAYA